MFLACGHSSVVECLLPKEKIASSSLVARFFRKLRFVMLTKIFAITDSHQETRNLSGLLSQIARENNENSSFLLLDCGDLFKGIYDRDLSVKAYLK